MCACRAAHAIESYASGIHARKQAKNGTGTARAYSPAGVGVSVEGAEVCVYASTQAGQREALHACVHS